MHSSKYLLTKEAIKGAAASNATVIFETLTGMDPGVGGVGGGGMHPPPTGKNRLLMQRICGYWILLTRNI